MSALTRCHDSPVLQQQLRISRWEHAEYTGCTWQRTIRKVVVVVWTEEAEFSVLTLCDFSAVGDFPADTVEDTRSIYTPIEESLEKYGIYRSSFALFRSIYPDLQVP